MIPDTTKKQTSTTPTPPRRNMPKPPPTTDPLTARLKFHIIYGGVCEVRAFLTRPVHVEALKSIWGNNGDNPGEFSRFNMFMLAVEHIQTDIVRLFFKHTGQRVNEQDADGYSALHVLCLVWPSASDTLEHKEELLMVLLGTGANSNAQTTDGKTPLYLCVERQCAWLCELLLRHHANINIGDRNERSPIFATGLGRTLDVLIAGRAEPNKKDCRGCTALYYAATSLDYPLCSKLLTAGADANVENHMGVSPMDVVKDFPLYLRLFTQKRDPIVPRGVRISRRYQVGE
jgi:ankyrin repeat protein